MNKNVFPYHNGITNRFGDPFEIDRLLTLHLGGDRKAAIDRTMSPDPGIAAMGMEALLNAISRAFAMPRLNKDTGEGCLEDALLTTFDQFLDWKAEQKKNAEFLPTSPESSDSPAFGASMSPTSLHG